MLQLDTRGFSADVLASMESVAKDQKQAQVDTKEGRLILMSEQEYRNMLATIELDSNPEMCRKILEGMATPLEDCLSEDEVVW